MKRLIMLIIAGTLLLYGCNAGDKEETEKFIQDAFKARAEAVFLFKDKQPLGKFFSPQAMEQTKEYLNWSPNGQWDNVKNLKYSTRLRIKDLKISGNRATAEVFETAVITWEYIDPAKVAGTAFTKEDAWSNRRHLITMELSPEGDWRIQENLIK